MTSNKVTSLWSLIGAALLLAESSCIAAEPKQEAAETKTRESGQSSAEPIGVATQEADGTIVLQLRTPFDSGIVGDALIRYAPGDPHYAAVARHVGPIPRGKSVPVNPFSKR